MIVAIIPARGGSQRIPRKNVKPFFGKAILAYSIEAARACGLFQRIYVSTDDVMIGIAAHHYGAIPVHRGAHLARNDVGTQEVARDLVLRLPEARYACCIYATAPLMDTQDLKRAFDTLVDQNWDFVYSVGPDGVDAGQFYWGSRDAFINREPLPGVRARPFNIAPERVCDINIPEDWARAEALYSKLTGKEMPR